jgi:hypothetical protein
MRAFRLAVVLVAGAALFGAPAVDAKDRSNSRSYNSYSNSYYYSSQKSAAELERQRKEQEKALQAALKAAQEAQKAAMRAAQKTQSSSVQVTTPTTTSKATVTTTQGADKAADTSSKTSAARNKTDDRGSDPDDVAAGADADDDVSDIFLSDTERQLRVIQRESQRAIQQAAREQKLLQEREAARAARIRERNAKRAVERPSEGASPGTAPGAGKPPLQQKPPVAVEQAEKEPDKANGNPLRPQLSERRTKWLEAYERKASGLGMGREAAKKAVEQARGEIDKDAAGARGKKPVASGSEDTASDPTGKSDGSKAEGKKITLAARSSALRRGTFPGKERGAELPIDLFETERVGELLATGLSAVDRATAEAHGFVVETPVKLKGVGTTVQRILPPPGLSPEEAERELHKVLPFASVTPNQAHSIFVGSIGEAERPSSTPPPGAPADKRAVAPASPNPCPQNTCFGSELIKWKGALGSCAKGVRIGIIDTSFDVDHPSLAHINVQQGDFLEGEAPSPYDWHGTAVLSLLAGDPRSGTPGLVPDATFLLATAFRSDAAGNASTDTMRLLSALDWLDGVGVDIVNMSFSGPRDEAVSRAIARMRQKGIVFIAAAGNGGPIAGPSYPAAYPEVIAVTAVNRNGENYRNANRGNYIDVAAPGVDVLTALPDAKQGFRTGTSFAAPFMTAILATHGTGISSVKGTKAQLLQQVSTRDLGPPGRDPIYGAGLALAPQRCQGGAGAIAKAAPPSSAAPKSDAGPAPQAAAGSPQPEIGAWSTATTLIRADTAGAAFAP